MKTWIRLVLLRKYGILTVTDLTDQNRTTPGLFGSPKSVVNDTKKVNMIRKIVAEDLIPKLCWVESFLQDLSAGISKRFLRNFNKKWHFMDRTLGKIAAEKENREIFSGYTMTLLSSLIKLSYYLWKTDELNRKENFLLQKCRIRKLTWVCLSPSLHSIPATGEIVR